VTISLIIPVLNDIENLSLLLKQTEQFQFHEVIVVDGGDSPQIEQLCKKCSAIYCQSSRGRGVQMNRGAEIASGETFWFLHADAHIPNEGDRIIEKALRTFGAGCFRFSFAGKRSVVKRLLSFGTNIRNQLGDTPFGDQGIFVERELFQSLDGFAPLPLFEEVPLIRQLKRSQQFIILSTPIAIDPRRYEVQGWIKTALAHRFFALLYLLNVPPKKIAILRDRTL